MTYAELKSVLADLRASGATCYVCTNLDCPEATRHSADAPGLPCENYIQA